jgi:hypothetical protein
MSILLFRSQMAQLVVLFCLGLSFIDKLYGTISGALKPRPVVMFESEMEQLAFLPRPEIISSNYMNLRIKIFFSSSLARQ